MGGVISVGAAGADVGVISAGVSFGEYGTGVAEIVAGVVGVIVDHFSAT